MELKIKVGERIKQLRNRLKITQKALAETSGLDRTFISHIENGKRNISIETLDRIIAILGVSWRKFFNTDTFE